MRAKLVRGKWGWRLVGKWLMGLGAIVPSKAARGAGTASSNRVSVGTRASAWIKCRPQALSLSFSSPREELSSFNVRFSSAKKRLLWGRVLIGPSLSISLPSLNPFTESRMSLVPRPLFLLWREILGRSLSTPRMVQKCT